MREKLSFKFKISNLNRGFTLVELIIYMGLLVIFLLVLSNIFASILDVRTESESISAVEQDGRFIMARLSYDINRASAVSTPASLGGSGNSLTMVIGSVNYTYALSGSNLVLTNDLGTNNLNSSESTISSLSFQRLGNSGGKDTVKIQFTVNSVAQRDKGVETKTFYITGGRR